MGLFGKLFGGGSDAAQEELPQQATLIDVRTPEEFATGHIKGAIHLPLVRFVHDIGRVITDKEAPVIVYCQSGGRSAMARQQMIDMGYRHVINGGGVRDLASRMNRDIER